MRLTNRIYRAAVGELCARDGDLAAVVERCGDPPFWKRPAGFATLVLIILEQQVSLASGRAAFERLRGAAGEVTPEAVARMRIDAIRAAGITRQKAEYLRDLAVQIAGGALDLQQLARTADEDARNRLIAIRGIGPWTADIYLLAALRRPDVWPDGDLALIEAARRAKRLRARPDRDRLRRIARGWQPWRSVAARILWHAYLTERGGAVPSS